MGFLQSYGSFLLKYPARILIGGISTVIALFCLTLLLRSLPTFKEPLIGFEARDTLISNRMNAWRLLFDETSTSANNLSLVPHSIELNEAHQPTFSQTSPLTNDSDASEDTNSSGIVLEPPVVEMSIQNNNTVAKIYALDEGEAEYYKSINETSTNLPSLMHYSLGSSKAFCGKLYDGYTQFVIAPSPRQSNSGLFNLNSMLSVCQLDRRIRLEHSPGEGSTFQRDCERVEISTDGVDKGSTCCNSWHLPNYIACLNNKKTCMDIDVHDMKNTENLLNLCAPYYYKAPYEECFYSSTEEDDKPHWNLGDAQSALNMFSSTRHGLDPWPTKTYCGNIPEKCLKCDGWIYPVMNHLTNENFIQNRMTNESNSSKITKQDKSIRANASIVNKLSYTNIFLPVAKSSSLLKYYQTLSRHNLKTPFAQVKAMDLGLKNSLFEHLISDETKLFVIALVTILIVISTYTWSIIVSLVILMIICLSLCLSYTIYELVLNIPVFPFMNLLAIVISFGICSDNAMLFCKHWISDYGPLESKQSTNDNSENRSNNNKEQSSMDRMLKRAIISTFVATAATTCSFIISAISKIIAVRCFCIFATLSVITNYLLIVLLLPPALVLDFRFSEMLKKYTTDLDHRVSRAFISIQLIRVKLSTFGQALHNRWIFYAVTEYKFYLIVAFITLLASSSVLVFYKPTLKPADEDEIQLLARRHAFEQYDKNLKRQFAFERTRLGEPIANSVADQLYDEPETLPVRIVFGIKPDDNGNHFDPYDRGSLTFDPKFDMADPNVQLWLSEFCSKLKQQRFIHRSTGPDLTNCFMDTFRTWMTRSCRDPIQFDVDRSPCCSSSEFPFTRYTFNRCIGDAVNIMRKTPQLRPNVNAGLRFFKNSTRVAAIIIEYQSNRLYTESFTKMERFFTDIDDWVSWQINNTAPPSLKSGWFISSNLELLALQTELEISTTTSIMLEVAFAMVALMFGTRDLILTLAATLTIGTIIIVTVAALILLKWTLGVAESILISLTIGLSIDFALHYSVAYSESRKKGANDKVVSRILEEVGSPIGLATLTTSLAGFVIVWSDILAYQELGIFLMLIAFTSWITSTFFLLPMLSTIGSFSEHEELNARVFLRRGLKFLIDRL